MARSVEDVREEIRLEALNREQQARVRAASTEFCVEDLREEIKRVAQAGKEAWRSAKPSPGQVPISRRNNVVYSARGNSRGHLSNSRSRPGTAGTITPVTPVTGWGGTKSIESPLLVPEMAGLAIAKTSAPIRAIQQQQHEHFDAKIPSESRFVRPIKGPEDWFHANAPRASMSARAPRKTGFRGSTRSPRALFGNVNSLASIEHTRLQGDLSGRKTDRGRTEMGNGSRSDKMKPVQNTEPLRVPKYFFVPAALRVRTQEGQASGHRTLRHDVFELTSKEDILKNRSNPFALVRLRRPSTVFQGLATPRDPHPQPLAAPYSFLTSPRASIESSGDSTDTRGRGCMSARGFGSKNVDLALFGTGQAQRSHMSAVCFHLKNGVDLGGGVRIVHAGNKSGAPGPDEDRERADKTDIQSFQVGRAEEQGGSAREAAIPPVLDEALLDRKGSKPIGDSGQSGIEKGQSDSSGEQQQADPSTLDGSESESSSSHSSSEVASSSPTRSSRSSSRASSARASRSSALSRHSMPSLAAASGGLQGVIAIEAVPHVQNEGENSLSTLGAVREDTRETQDGVATAGVSTTEVENEIWRWEDLEDSMESGWDQWDVASFSRGRQRRGAKVFVPLTGSSSRLNEFQMTDTRASLVRPSTSVRQALQSLHSRHAQYIATDIVHNDQNLHLSGREHRLKSTPRFSKAYAHPSSMMLHYIFFRKISETLECKLRDVTVTAADASVEVGVTESLEPKGFDSIFGGLMSACHLSPPSTAASRRNVAQDKVLINADPPRLSGEVSKPISISSPWSEVETAVFGIGGSGGGGVLAGPDFGKYRILEVVQCTERWHCGDLRVESKAIFIRQQTTSLLKGAGLLAKFREEKADSMMSTVWPGEDGHAGQPTLAPSEQVPLPVDQIVQEPADTRSQVQQGHALEHRKSRNFALAEILNLRVDYHPRQRRVTLSFLFQCRGLVGTHFKAEEAFERRGDFPGAN